jgi:hypothetical protein
MIFLRTVPRNRRRSTATSHGPISQKTPMLVHRLAAIVKHGLVSSTCQRWPSPEKKEPAIATDPASMPIGGYIALGTDCCGLEPVWSGVESRASVRLTGENIDRCHNARWHNGPSSSRLCSNLWTWLLVGSITTLSWVVYIIGVSTLADSTRY